MQRHIYKFYTPLALMICFSLCLFISSCTEETPEEPFAATAAISTSVSTVTEGGNSPEITISFNTDNTSGSALTIRYTVSGSASSGTDYSAITGSISIPDGDTEASFSIEVLDDEAVEENETIIITLDTSGQPDGISIGNSNSITITIQDNDEEEQNNDPNQISISADVTDILEGETNPVITFSLSQVLESEMSFDYRISGTAENGIDYTELSGSITIASGEQSGALEIELTDDEEVEEAETIIISINGMALPSGIVIGENREVTITVSDNDEAQIIVNVEAVSNGAEGGDNPSFEIILDQPVTEATTFIYSLSGTATADEDFTSPLGEVTIEANEESTVFEITLIDDEAVEDEETIIVTLVAADLPEGFLLGESTEATATISDNDEENTATPITLTFDASDGNSITVGSWTEVNDAEGYIILINTENDFDDLANDQKIAASTTYVGTGTQAVYDSEMSEDFTVTLLQDQTTYYFKVVPYDSDGAYDNDQDTFEASTMSCTTDSETENQVCFTIFEANDTRYIVSNQYPDHETGSFPNADVTAVALETNIDLTPSNTGEVTLVYNETGGPTPSNPNFWRFGVASNGLGYNPMGLKPWTNPDTGEENWEWQAAVVDEGNTFLDEYSGHVTSQGQYHYHGDITGLATDEDGSRHSLLYGWAADGFPIYYKYAYVISDDPNSGIIELKSSYQLKSGDRGGDGTTAPDGTHDGTYIQDYEFVEGLGDLDECNGRMGITPEYPNGTYYYVITTDFPKIPNCFVGTPSEDFQIGR
ncbi:MAG: YHYH protein [Cytophagales bacterium]|nr:YHYH protein [Cytophagales bacterium]